MSHLALTLFGGFHAQLDGKFLTTFKTDKNRALLVYLVLECRQPHRREALASLLWPGRAESKAHNSLRQALYTLRHCLAQGGDGGTPLLISATEAQFNFSNPLWIDVMDFKNRISDCWSCHPEGETLCLACQESLQQAVDLYQGDFLAGFTLPNCPAYTDWQTITQEAFHNQAILTLMRLADTYEQNYEYEQVVACMDKLIQLEPWRESAYRRQMWVLAAIGERERALRQYELLREILHCELGALPLNGTRQLYEQILRDEVPKTINILN